MKIGILSPYNNSKSVKVLLNELKNTSYYNDHNTIPDSEDIIFVLNYDKVIPKKIFSKFKLGMIVIHSTDLPKGRGWAPIYYSISNNEPEYVITALKIAEKVDSGNFLIKLRIKKPKFISNEDLRSIDEDGTIIVVKELIKKLDSTSYNCFQGVEQDANLASYNPKRKPSDNEIDGYCQLNKSILSILASNEVNYPAYVVLEGEKIYLTARTERSYSINELEYSIEIFF